MHPSDKTVTRRSVIGALAAVPLASATLASDRLDPIRVIQSGHSLTNDVVPPLYDMVRATSMRGGKLEQSTIPGSPMDWRWNNAATPDIRQPQIMAGYDVLVITERVPLTQALDAHDSRRWALHWITHAARYGADGRGARSVLYASWVHIDSGPASEYAGRDPEGHLTFRERMPLEMSRWQEILDHVNANLPAETPQVPMIPGPLVMARAYDLISEGSAPGIDQMELFFRDAIHLTPLGGYLMALAHYMVIYDADPRGLPHGVPARGGPNREQAAWMQELVWSVVSDYQARAV